MPDERIRFEAFGPSSVARSATGAPAAGVPVVFRRMGRDAAWTPADGTLLEFAEGQRVAVPSECRSGSCGTCATRVLSGAVGYEQAPDAPVEPGCALLCVARPAQGRSRSCSTADAPCDMRPQTACCAKSARNCFFFGCRSDRR